MRFFIILFIYLFQWVSVFLTKWSLLIVRIFSWNIFIFHIIIFYILTLDPIPYILLLLGLLYKVWLSKVRKRVRRLSRSLFGCSLRILFPFYIFCCINFFRFHNNIINIYLIVIIFLKKGYNYYNYY